MGDFSLAGAPLLRALLSMFDDSGPRVDLRGASKKQDRRALLARAQREREERELQRKRAREALRLQTCYRAHLDLGRARAAARASFDSEMALAFAPRAAGLIRALLFFFSEVQPADAERLRGTWHDPEGGGGAGRPAGGGCGGACNPDDPGALAARRANGPKAARIL